MNLSSGSKRRTLALLAFGLLSGVVVLLIFYTNVLNRAFEDESKINLQELARQSASTLDKQFSGELKTVVDLADSLAIHRQLSEDDTWESLRLIAQKNRFRRIGILLTDGSCRTTDGVTWDTLAQDSAFYASLLGKAAGITSPVLDMISGERVNLFYAPIEVDGVPSGVLFAQHETAEYQQSMGISAFSEKGDTYVVSSTGELIFHFYSGGSTNSRADILSVIRADASEVSPSLDQMNADLLAGKSGQIHYVLDQNLQYMNYTPTQINDWYLLSVIPADAINTKTSTVLFYTVVLYLFFLAGFASLFWYLYITQSRHLAQLRRLTLTDSLTGLDNLVSFENKAARLLHDKAAGRYVLVKFDIDQFKSINDLYGYQNGNRILQHIADVLRRDMGGDELYAHMSGDEFILLLQDDTDDRLIDRLRQIDRSITDWGPEREERPYYLTLSFGLYRLENTQMEISAIIDRAAMAQKTIKGFRHNFYAFYDDAIREKMLHDKQIEEEMEEALRGRELVVYYQLKNAVIHGGIVGAEALVRWQHPTRGLLLPGEFISVLEKNGFIVHLDYYVFEQVCRDLRTLADCGKKLVPVSVNLSRLHLSNDHLAEDLSGMVQKYALSPEWIELEWTESVVSDNMEQLHRLSGQLRDAGFSLSMDDFGSGYSSLNLLKDIQVDTLKLDREFVRETADNNRGREIITSIVTLAKDLHIQVVAEGVEFQYQMAFLRQIHCDTAQGFLFGKPMPFTAFAQLLKSAHPEKEE